MAVEKCKLSIQNFGPINEGCGDGWVEVDKCALFIGPQGSGKSSIAKLIAECLKEWGFTDLPFTAAELLKYGM